ncbi:hypothetical protein [Bradyrhizobium sp.]|uniref:hypothetical protein n=1 Tax=Bradyrhizobium sp. TaxID=376 RepID=UPI002627A746|nr:hypothetical protein [Bradyrhizobium sp.]
MYVPATDRSRAGKPRTVSALLGSYGRDLKGWIAKLAAGYGIAAALMLVGVLAVFAAIVVGFIALFHFVALRYGEYVGFAVIGGGLLLLGIILLLVGYAMTRRKTAPLPRPRRQFRAARQMLLGNTIARAFGALHSSEAAKEAGKEAAKPDATTQILLGTAAIIAVGWIAANHLGSKAPGSRTPADQVRR